MPFESHKIDWSKPWQTDEAGLVNAPLLDGEMSFDIFDAGEWPGNSEDARKIAALVGVAPELLAVLKEIAEVPTTAETPGVASDPEFDEMICKARAAVAKAMPARARERV